jgi:hypothetical protein
VRSGQDSDSNKSAHEEQVQDDKHPAEELGSATLEAEVDNQRGDGVGRCSGENALDCAGGVAHIADHSVDLVETRREETKGAESVVSTRTKHRKHV